MKIAGILLIVLGLYVGYLGINKLSANTNEVKVLGLDIDISNEKGQTKGILLIIGAFVLVGGGAVLLKKK